MLRILFCVFLTFGLTGCAKLSHLQELLTMKALSDNQTLQKKYVAEQDKKFQALLAAVESGDIKNYSDKKSFLKKFGEPIYSKTIDKQEATQTRLLYRYSAKLHGSEKVYVYFDTEGKLAKWEYIKPPVKATKP